MQSQLLKSALLVVVSSLVSLLGTTAFAQSQEYSKADVERLMKERSNWGRWGKDDQLGTLNLITPEKRVQAAALVKEGTSVSLARTVEKKVAADNPQPFLHKMLATGKGEG